MKDAEPGITLLVAMEKCGSAVGGTIINNDELKVGKTLREDAPDCFGEKALPFSTLITTETSGIRMFSCLSPEQFDGKGKPPS